MFPCTPTVAGELVEQVQEIIASVSQEVEQNVYFAGPMGMEATYDRVLLLEDEFRSGYECEACSKSGKVKCPNCKGDGQTTLLSMNPNQAPIVKKCSHCNGEKEIKCDACGGKGELLVIPDVAKRRPTTGIIVSVGCDVREYKIGEYAAYPNFCGEVWELSGLDREGNESTIVLRIIKEKELLCRVTGHLSLKRMKHRASQISG